jgi:hypothetical protein
MSTPSKRGIAYYSKRATTGRGFINERDRWSRPYVRLSLPLLVAGVAADDMHDAATADDFALVANPFNAGSYLHALALSAPADYGETVQYTALTTKSSRPRGANSVPIRTLPLRCL